MPELFIDIETLPGPTRPDPSEIEAPKNYKDPAKIEAYQQEKVEEVYRAQALDSMKGQVLAIGYALDDGPIECLIQGLDEIFSEPDLLEAFQERLFAEIKNPLILDWVGHNLRTFDLAWIWRRALKYRLFPLANLIPRGRYNKRVVDTLELWAADFKDRVSLDALARFLGLEGKPDGIDGGQVFDFFQAGRLEEIREYCRQDVALTRDVYTILTGEDVGVF